MRENEKEDKVQNEIKKTETKVKRNNFCVLRWRFDGETYYPSRRRRRLLCLQLDCESGHLKEIEIKKHSNFAKLEKIDTLNSLELTSKNTNANSTITKRCNEKKLKQKYDEDINNDADDNDDNDEKDEYYENSDYHEYFKLKDLNTDPLILWQTKKFNTATVSPIRYTKNSTSLTATAATTTTTNEIPSTKNVNVNVSKRQQSLHWTIYNVLRNIPWLHNLPNKIRVLFVIQNYNNDVIGRNSCGSKFGASTTFSCAAAYVDTRTGYLRSIEHVYPDMSKSEMRAQLISSYILVICDNYDTFANVKQCLALDTNAINTSNRCDCVTPSYFAPMFINCCQFFSNYSAIFSKVVGHSCRGKYVNSTELLKFALCKREKMRKKENMRVINRNDDDDDDDNEIKRKQIKHQRNEGETDATSAPKMSTSLYFDEIITDDKLKHLMLKTFFLNVVTTLIKLSRMSHLPFDVVSESRLEDIVEFYFSVEYAKLGFWPHYSRTTAITASDDNKPSDSKSNVRGGLVLDVTPTQNEVCEFDFFMLYPSIISNCNLGIGTTFLMSQISSGCSNESIGKKKKMTLDNNSKLTRYESRKKQKLTLSASKKTSGCNTATSTTTSTHENNKNIQSCGEIESINNRSANSYNDSSSKYALFGKSKVNETNSTNTREHLRNYFVPSVGQVVILESPKSPFSRVMEKLILQRKQLHRITCGKQSENSNYNGNGDNKYNASTSNIYRDFSKRENHKIYYESDYDNDDDYCVTSTLIKLLANIAFGLLWTRRASFLGDRVVASTVTSLGRQLLVRVSNEFQRRGFKIVAGDTDSLFVEIREKFIPVTIPSSLLPLPTATCTSNANEGTASLQYLANEILRNIDPLLGCHRDKHSLGSDYTLLFKNHFQRFACVQKKRYVGVRTFNISDGCDGENLVVVKGIEKCISKSFRKIFEQLIVYRFTNSAAEELYDRRRIAKRIALLTFYRTRFLVYDKSTGPFAVVGLAEERVLLRANDCDWKQFRGAATTTTSVSNKILTDTQHFAPVSARYIVCSGKRHLILSDVLITQHKYSPQRAELIIQQFITDIVEEQIKIILKHVAPISTTTKAKARNNNQDDRDDALDDNYDYVETIQLKKIIHFNHHRREQSKRQLAIVSTTFTTKTTTLPRLRVYRTRNTSPNNYNSTLSLLEETFTLSGHPIDDKQYQGKLQQQQLPQMSDDIILRLSLVQTPENALFFHPPISPRSAYTVEDGQSEISSLLCMLAINGYTNSCDEKIFQCIELSKQRPQCLYALNTSIGVYVFKGENFFVFIKSC